MATQPQFHRPESNKQQKKFVTGSEGWLRPPEFLEFAPYDELKKRRSLIEGHVPDAILKVERVRFPRTVSQAVPGRFGH
jgi:hypothetical protein